MSYMLLIVEPVGQRRERSEDEGRGLYDSMLQFADGLKARGVLVAAQALRSDEAAARSSSGLLPKRWKWWAAFFCSTFRPARRR